MLAFYPENPKNTPKTVSLGDWLCGTMDNQSFNEVVA